MESEISYTLKADRVAFRELFLNLQIANWAGLELFLYGWNINVKVTDPKKDKRELGNIQTTY